MTDWWWGAIILYGKHRSASPTRRCHQSCLAFFVRSTPGQWSSQKRSSNKTALYSKVCELFSCSLTSFFSLPVSFIIHVKYGTFCLFNAVFDKATNQYWYHNVSKSSSHHFVSIKASARGVIVNRPLRPLTSVLRHLFPDLCIFICNWWPLRFPNLFWRFFTLILVTLLALLIGNLSTLWNLREQYTSNYIYKLVQKKEKSFKFTCTYLQFLWGTFLHCLPYA